MSSMFQYKRKKEIIEKVADLVREAKLSDIPILLHLLSEYPQAANKTNPVLNFTSPFIYSMQKHFIPPDFALSMWKIGAADVVKMPDFKNKNYTTPITATVTCPEFLPILQDCVTKGVSPDTKIWSPIAQSLLQQSATYYNYEAIEYLQNLEGTNKHSLDGFDYWRDGPILGHSEISQILKYRPHMLCDENRMEKTYHLLMNSGLYVNEEPYCEDDWDRISEHIKLGVDNIGDPVDLFNQEELKAGGIRAENVRIKNKILLRNRTYK